MPPNKIHKIQIFLDALAILLALAFAVGQYLDNASYPTFVWAQVIAGAAIFTPIIFYAFRFRENGKVRAFWLAMFSLTSPIIVWASMWFALRGWNGHWYNAP